jgi:hypothetical protein
VWQTVDGKLHFADNIGTEESYTLTYVEKAAPAPRVTSIELQPKAGANEATATKAKVVFAESIDATTFTADDVMLVAGGQQIPVVITPVAESGNTAFLLDWSEASFTSGSTSLTVYTAGVSNTEETTGTTSMNKTWKAFMVGDVNGDGSITAQDASLVLQLVANKITAQTEGIVYEAANVNNDEGVTAQDASLILQYVAGKISW